MLFEHFPRGVPARRAHDAAAGVGGRAAQVEALDGRAVVGVADDGAEQEELVQRHRALEDVAAGQVEGLLQVERRQHLPGDDRLLEVRRVLVRAGRSSGRRTFFVASSQVPRLSLYGAYWMNIDIRCLPGGATVGSTDDGMVHSSTGFFDGTAVLGVVVGAFDVILIGAEVHGAVVLRADARAGAGREVLRRFGEGDVDLERGAAVVDAGDRFLKVGGQPFLSSST